MFDQVRDYIIERGLSDCRGLRDEGKGPEGFYDGAVDGFEACRGFEDLDPLKARIHELQEEELTRRMGTAIYGHPSEPSKVKEWWYWRGYLMQLEFTLDRLSLLEALTHGHPETPMVSARAVIDVLDLTQRILPPMQENVEEHDD